MKIELRDPADSAKVISIEIARQRSFTLSEKSRCNHFHVTLDRLETQLTCVDCKAKISPIEYIAMLVERWAWVKRLSEEYIQNKAIYEAKQRCRCEHCHKITSVRPATAAEVRAFRRGIQQDQGPKL